MHGGMTPGGTASPHFRTGRYSKYLPQELLNKYNEAQKDPDLLNLRDEIGLMDARLKQLIEKLPSGGASHSWTEIKDAWKSFLEAQREANAARTDEQRTRAQNKVADALRSINEIIDEGAKEAGLWNDIIISVDNRRKLTASEARRLTDMQQTITAEKAMALVYAVLDIIRRNAVMIPDADLQKKFTSKVAEGVRALVTIPARSEIEE